MMFVLKLILNILYPAYATFKAFRSKKAKEYVCWMQYWIVFALYGFVETLTDALLFWMPFYAELKIFALVWMVIPVWKDCLGSGLIYQKFVHPVLMEKEPLIDAFIEKIKKQVATIVMKLISRFCSVVLNFVVDHAFAAFARPPQLAPPVNVDVFSSDSETEETFLNKSNKRKKKVRSI